MNTDLMIDLETLDVLPTATVLTIGAVKFDPFGDDLADPKMEKFYVKVDVDSCDRLGCTVSQATLDWWASQSKEAQEEAFDPNGRISIEDALNQLYKFCWGRQTCMEPRCGLRCYHSRTSFPQSGQSYSLEFLGSARHSNII